MFLNESKFIAQVKRAYKSIGVTIADYRGMLVFDISNVTVGIMIHDVSNRIKGLVMELAGSFPKSDTSFYISKEHPNPQYEMKDLDKFIKKIENGKFAINKLHVSPFIQSYQDVRLLHTNQSKIYGIKEDLRIIALKYDETSMSQPTGPAYADKVDDGIYYTSENGIVIILPSNVRESELITALETVDIQAMIDKENKKT